MKSFWMKQKYGTRLGVIALGAVLTMCCFLAGLANSLNEETDPPPPTAEVEALFTQAAETIMAQLTLDAPTITSTVRIMPTETFTPTLEFTPTLSVSATAVIAGASCIPDNPPETGTVVDVVDGDTIKVLMDEDGATYSIRYIGMDTPESTSTVEYYGYEATAFNSSLVAFKKVTLVKDVSETDQYGRLLRYVIVDGYFVNYYLVFKGYATAATYPPDVACEAVFRAAEKRALSSKTGLWGAPPTNTPWPTSAATSPPPAGNCHPSYPTVCIPPPPPDLNCPEISYRNFKVVPPDPHGFDRDGDGVGCEE